MSTFDANYEKAKAAAARPKSSPETIYERARSQEFRITRSELLFARHAHSDEEASIESLSQESDQRKERERGLRALKSQQDSASKAFHGAVADHIAGLKNS